MKKVSVFNLISKAQVSVFLLALTLFMVASNNSNAADKVIKWKLQAAISPASSTYEQSVLRVVEKVKKETNGRLIIEPYSAGALLPNKEIFPSVKRGMLEMGFVTPSYWKSDISLSLVSALPFAFTNYWEVMYFNKVLGFEKMLAAQVAEHGVDFYGDHAIPVEIVTKTPIRSIDDFKGKKIRTYGQFGKFFNALGAQAVSAPGPEIYTGLATGVFDGAHWAAAVGADSLALYEVCKYHLKPSISLGTEEAWFVNQKAFNKLPEDIQVIVKKILEEQFWTRSVEYAYNESKILGKVQQKQGVEVVTLSSEDQKKMATVAMSIWDEVANVNPENKKAVEMMKDFLRELGRLD